MAAKHGLRLAMLELLSLGRFCPAALTKESTTRSIVAVSATVLLSAPALAPRALAGQCDGDGRHLLEMPDTAELGTSIQICMQGPANDTGFFMASLGQGPIESKYGPICLDFPLLVGFAFPFDSSGSYCFDVDVPCDPSAIGVTVYAQFITCGKVTRGASNQDSIAITDGLCVGDIVTHTQESWGDSCEHDNAGCLRDSCFAAVFPNGITLGDQDGTDGDHDGQFALHFTSAEAVAKFLPASGAAGILRKDATDPTSSKAGVFAGELLAAKIALAFDDAGCLDDVKNRDDLKLGELLFVSGVNPDLFDWSVRQVIDVCDLIISGALGDGDIDIDGDGDQDATIPSLSDALKVLSENFDDGSANRGSLRTP